LLVEQSYLSEWIALQLLEAHLMIAARGDQSSLFKERIIQSRVAREDAVIHPIDVGLLQVGVPGGRIEIVLRRSEHDIRIAVDVDETGIWKEFEQESDASRVRRRFEDQCSIVLIGQLLDKVEEGRLPFGYLRGRHA